MGNSMVTILSVSQTPVRSAQGSSSVDEETKTQRGSETSSLPPSEPPGEPVQFFRVLTQHFLPCCQAEAEADSSPGPIPEAFALFPAQLRVLYGATSRTEAASSSQDLVATTAPFRSRRSSGMDS